VIASFSIKGVLTRELDRGAGFMNFAPRIMMSLDDLSSTGLVGMGSRVTLSIIAERVLTRILLLIVSGQSDLLMLKIYAVEMRIEYLVNAQPMMRKTLERAEQFLSLIALLTAMISAVAIALSARRYAVGQADVYATWKCFGARAEG
jgi:putative ABC transport system permease protein